MASFTDKASSFGRCRYSLAIRMIGEARRPKLPSPTWSCRQPHAVHAAERLLRPLGGDPEKEQIGIRPPHFEHMRV